MGLLSKLFGKKVNVPAFVGVDIDEVQEGAIDANLRNVGKAKSLALAQQSADQEALEQGLRRAISGYDSLVGSQRNVIDDFLGGRVPGDVADKLADRAAARGIRTGTTGSQAVKFDELRNYGLTSLDMKQRGLGMARDFITQQVGTAMARPMSVTDMFFSPTQRLAHKTQERDTKWTRDYAAAKMAAAPDPRFSGLLNTGMQAAGMYFGHVGTMAMANAIGGGQQAAAPQVAAPQAAAPQAAAPAMMNDSWWGTPAQSSWYGPSAPVYGPAAEPSIPDLSWYSQPTAQPGRSMLNMARGFAPFMPQQGTDISGAPSGPSGFDMSYPFRPLTNWGNEGRTLNIKEADYSM